MIRRAFSILISILVALMLLATVWTNDLRFVGREREEQQLQIVHSRE